MCKQLENSKDRKSEIFRLLFLYEHKYGGIFSNLHKCTLIVTSTLCFYFMFLYRLYVPKKISFVIPKNDTLVVRSLAILNELKIPPT